MYVLIKNKSSALTCNKSPRLLPRPVYHSGSQLFCDLDRLLWWPLWDRKLSNTSSSGSKNVACQCIRGINRRSLAIPHTGCE
ncbi:hypothetical protein FKM82_022018 [Ascaphus truei]